MSASRSPTAAPVWASAIARLTAMVDFPTPPLPLAMAIMCWLIRSSDCMGHLLTTLFLTSLGERGGTQVVRIVETGQDRPLLIDTQLRQGSGSHGKLPVRLRR